MQAETCRLILRLLQLAVRGVHLAVAVRALDELAVALRLDRLRIADPAIFMRRRPKSTKFALVPAEILTFSGE